MASYQDFLDQLQTPVTVGCAYCGNEDHEVESCPKLAHIPVVEVTTDSEPFDALEQLKSAIERAKAGDVEALEQLPALRRAALAPISGLSPSSSLTLPQQAALDSFLSRAPRIIDEARSITVTDQPTLEQAAKFRQDIKAATDLLEAFKRPEINRAYKSHKDALAELNQLLAPWTTADTIVKIAQDAYHLKQRREREETARRFEEAQRKIRDEDLAKQLAEAEQAQSPELIEEVLERAITPAPVIPVIHTTTKAEGSSARVVHDFDLIDPDKIDPRFVMLAIKGEIGRLGRCDWLLAQIKREVGLRGKEAEKTVGEGSIRYRDGMSTGVRRRKG